MAELKDFPLRLIKPDFGSKLTDFVIDLDHLRRKEIRGTTHSPVFFQLKSLFQTLESIGSARIEGNNTTVSDFIETKLEKTESVDQQIQEIQNIEACISFIDAMPDELHIDRKFISELHQILVKDLLPPPRGEGDLSPGLFRQFAVEIKGSEHKPPETSQQIDAYMQELFDFLAQDDSPKYDLLKIALAHHRFMWIHPFSNGNGRVGRLLTYALLVKAGFNVHLGRILNPTAVFCIDRNAYYDYLAEADKGTEEGLTTWCTYVLEGLKKEIDKVDRLADYDYLKSNILLPALKTSFERKYIDTDEYEILKLTAEKQIIQNADVKLIFKNKHSSAISRTLKGLKDKGMLVSEVDNERRYHISFSNNLLTRRIIAHLEKEHFISLN